MGAIAQNWTIALWSATAGICAVFAAINFLVWFSRRQSMAHGLFAIMAACVAVMAMGELALMHSTQPTEYIAILRWTQVPVFLLVVSIVGFVRVYLRAGRLGLGLVAIALRAIGLVVNFLSPYGLHFERVTGLHQVPFLGGSGAVAIGERNPWMAVAQLSLLLLVVFVFDASVAVWRRGERRRAVVAGGAILGFVLLGLMQAVTSFWGFHEMPLTPSLFFSGMVVVMGFELSRDILRIEKLATDLREGERRLSLAAAAAHLGIWTRDHRTGEVWASPEWRKIFGFSDREPITMETFLQRVHPEDRVGIKDVILSSSTCRPYELEYRIIRPGGQCRWIASRGMFDFDQQGRALSACGVSIDVSARKETEQALQDQRSELAHLSRVAMLGELSGSLAHELNQPLTAILSNAQAAQRFLALPEIDRAELGDILHDIVEADQRAGEVIRSLRALFKKGKAERQPVHLNAVISDVLRLVHSDALNRRIAVQTALDPADPSIIADPVQLQQVLLNLILNAIDAMSASPETDRRLVVSSQVLPDEGVRVSVRDHGPGVAADLRKKIFEPFFTTKPHGLGLGLGMCRSIIEAHGSCLELAPASTHGAEFFFILPFRKERL